MTHTSTSSSVTEPVAWAPTDFFLPCVGTAQNRPQALITHSRRRACSVKLRQCAAHHMEECCTSPSMSEKKGARASEKAIRAPVACSARRTADPTVASGIEDL